MHRKLKSQVISFCSRLVVDLLTRACGVAHDDEALLRGELTWLSMRGARNLRYLIKKVLTISQETLKENKKQ